MRIRASTLILTWAGLVSPVSPELIEFQPAEGSRVAKTMRTTWGFAIDELDVQLNGEGLPDDVRHKAMSKAYLQATSQVRFVDEYGRVEGGRPQSLRRTFDAFELEIDNELGFDGIHPEAFLEDVTLTFAWDRGAQAYSITSDVPSLDLDDVVYRGEDMDLRALLPRGDVERGDTWLVEGNEVLSVVWPGLDWGQVRRSMAEVLERFALPIDADVLIEDVLETASIRCRLQGERVVAEGRYQVIAIEAKMEREVDVSELLIAVFNRAYTQGMDLEADADVELEAALQGELLWDAAAGRLASLEMALDYALSMDVEASFGPAENKTRVVVHTEASGALSREIQASDER